MLKSVIKPNNNNLFYDEGLLTLRPTPKLEEHGEEHRLMMFENKVLRKIFGANRDEITGN